MWVFGIDERAVFINEFFLGEIGGEVGDAEEF
ncbi:MAG: hypothetical protein ACJAQT_001989 [Akkermansiaceae bacterium]